LWWYNSVATLEASHGWLDEGLVELSVFHYLQARYGEQSASTLLEEYKSNGENLRNRYPDGKLDKPLQQFVTEEEFHWTWYSRGALLFDNLRRQIGDDAYKQFLKRVQRNYHGRVIGAEHLDQALGQTLQGEAKYFRNNTQRRNGTSFGKVQLEPYVTTMINGMSYYPSIPARVSRNTVYIPLREVGERLGVAISWSKEKQMIRIQGYGREVFVKERDRFAVLDGKRLDLGMPLMEVKDRTMVPLSFFQEALGLEVNYNDQERTVKLTTQRATGKAVEKQ
jgi:hypothetical protein